MCAEEEHDYQIRSRRLEARHRQDIANEKRRINHRPIAAALRDPLLSAPVIAAAIIQVERWRREGLCSSDYIDAWEALLAAPEEAAVVLEEISLYADQMRQNSPFVDSIRMSRRQTIIDLYGTR